MGTVFLLSGGLDSCVALAGVIARGAEGPRLALTFDYRQRAAAREVEAARAIAARYGVDHRAIALGWLGGITRTALVDRSAEVPRPEPEALDSEGAVETAKAVWVPNRNGVFIAVAAAHAEAIGAACIITGFNREEGATFPDNTPEFVERTNAALALSTLAKVRVEGPLGGLDKVEIVRRARDLGVPLELCWPCYEGGEELCGTCESCRRFERALERAGAGAAAAGRFRRARHDG